MDAHPVPRFNDTSDVLSGASWFSTLDLASGYYQVKLAEEDQKNCLLHTLWPIPILANAIWAVQCPEHVSTFNGASPNWTTLELMPGLYR